MGFTTKKKIASRDDDEVDDRVEEHAWSQDRRGFRVVQLDLPRREVGQPQETEQGRHDIGDEGSHHRSERHADDERDREVHHVAPQHELPELLDHVVSPPRDGRPATAVGRSVPAEP